MLKTSNVHAISLSVDTTPDALANKYYGLKNKEQLASMTFAERLTCAYEITSGMDVMGLNTYRVDMHSTGMHASSLQSAPTINLASNNYLNFSVRPEIKLAASQATEQYGHGSGSVPMLSGTFKVHRELEKRLAKFTGYEAALSYCSGYAANQGLLTALLTPSDIAILDTYVHASINEGCSNTNKSYFMHNDPDSLRLVLQKSQAYQNKIVIVDGVYSMDGDIANLPEIIRIAREFGAWVLVDESHALGVIGENGVGTANYFALTDKPDLITCSMGKALGATGGFVAGSRELISLLELTSRTFIYSTSLPPGIAAGIIKAIDLLEQSDAALSKLWNNIRYFREHCQPEWQGITESKSAIFPLFIKEEGNLLHMASTLRKKGIFVVPIFYPVVPKRKSRIRISLNAALSSNDLQCGIDNIISTLYMLGIK